MKKLLAATFVALLMVGCGEKPGEDSPESNQTSAETPPVKFPEIVKIDLGDPETQKIIAEAIDFKKLQNRGEELEYVLYQKKPYSGWAREMWDNGQIYALSQYKDGKKDGLETHWYRNGQKHWEENYKDGKLDGSSTEWYKNGQKMLERNYKDGEVDGLEAKWHENGQKQWDAGSGEVLDDPETLDKIIAEAIDYEKLQRRQSEEAIAYDTRRGWGFGTLAYAPNKQTPYSGWGKTMYYNRQIRMLSQFKDGRQTGLSRTWYENGQKESEKTYRNDKRDGPAKSWNENGQKSSGYTYKDGQKDGSATGWYENGQKESERTYKDGKVMTIVVWKYNGEKCPVTNLKDGNGVWVHYWPDGTDWKVIYTYEDGEKVKTSRDYGGPAESNSSKESNQPATETPDAKITQVGGIDLDDPATLDKITAEAIDWKKFEHREGELGSGSLAFLGNQKTPYTGWMKNMYGKGQIYALTQLKDGNANGLNRTWYSNGQKSSEITWKDGKKMSAVVWKPNGERCPVTNLKDGNGVVLTYGVDGTEDGTVSLHSSYKNGEFVLPPDSLLQRLFD
jgi:antitoxin component YwqK of YwqJK toxin-antitoxin module